MTGTVRYSNLEVRDSERTIGVAVYDYDREKVVALAEEGLHRQAASIAAQVGAVGYEFDADLTAESVWLAANDYEMMRSKWRVSTNPPLRLLFIASE